MVDIHFQKKGVVPAMEIEIRGLATQMNLSTTFSIANTFEKINTINERPTNSWQVTMVFNQPTTANDWVTNAFQNSFLPLMSIMLLIQRLELIIVGEV